MACIITYENKQYTQKEFEQYFKEHFTEFVGEFITTKPDVILPIGTSGSGKSTFIKSLPQENLVVIEPDAMRVEFTGNMNDKSKDKEIYVEAANRAIKAIKGEPNLRYGYTRLYRAENEKGIDSPAPDWVKENQQVKESQKASGRWFYKTYEEAKYHSDKFGGEISYVDIPTNEVEKYNAKENKFAGGYGKQGNEYFVSKEIAGDRKNLILKPKQVVFDTTNLTKDKRLPFIEAIKKAIPNANIQYKLMELNPELAKQRIKAQLERGENRAVVSDETIDRHAESYKQMLEDIKNEPITEYKELGSKADIQGFKEFVQKDNSSEINSSVSDDIDLKQFTEVFGDITEVQESDVEAKVRQLEKEGLLEIDCSKAKAKDGIRGKFTKGSQWEIVKDLKGYPSHSQGGVDVKIGKNGFSFTRDNGVIEAKYGLVLPKIK